MDTDLRHQETVTVRATPEQVWGLVTDIARTGEWSPVCTHCSWDAGDGPALGATFTGHNEADGRTWRTRSTVVACEPNREFAWEVGDGFVRWGYTLAPVEEGTALTESWAFLPAGLALFHEKYGDQADEMIATRTRQAHEGIPETLAAIARIAESR